MTRPLTTAQAKARQPFRWPAIPLAALTCDEQLLKLAEWYADLCLIPAGEYGQQIVFEAAEHALALGKKNPAGLMVRRIRDWHRRDLFPVPGRIGDKAHKRLKMALGHLDQLRPREPMEDVYL